MEFMVERTLQVPPGASPRLVADIEHYNAFVELQARMSGPASWYQRLA